jgi:predicted aconitase with swiveling domain
MRREFPVRGVLKGRARGPALLTNTAVNFTAAFTKIANILPARRAEIRDRHHPWFGKNIKGRVIMLPTCIGSTHTGLVLLDLVRMHNGPAAMIVDHADSLLVSGIVLADVWYGASIPVVECDTTALRQELRDGDDVEVDADNARVVVHAG